MRKKYTREDAERFHSRLPAHIRGFLRQVRLPDYLIDKRLLGWNGEHITVPVFDDEGKFLFFEYLSDPGESRIPEPVERDTYSPAHIYGWETLLSYPAMLLVTDSAFDRLVLESRRFRTIAVLGDTMSFKEAWVPSFQGLRQVFILFRATGKQQRAARRLGKLIPQARVVELPGSIGWKGTVAEYFLTRGHDREDLLKELLHARSGFPGNRHGNGRKEGR